MIWGGRRRARPNGKPRKRYTGGQTTMRGKICGLSNRLPLERMRGRDVELLPLPGKRADEADAAYQQRLRSWEGYQWRQFGMKKLVAGERVVGEEEQWVKDLIAEFGGGAAAADVPDFDSMRLREARAEAKRLLDQVQVLQAARDEEEHVAQKPFANMPTPRTKGRVDQQLGLSP